MKYLFFTIFLILLLSFTMSARNLYVSGTGSDGNNGLTVNQAFRNIQKAADLTQPGDVVNVLDGVYTQDDPNTNIVIINNSGTANAPITYRAYPGSAPKLVSKNWNAFNINGAAYIVISGFEIQGNSDGITYNYAYAERNNTNNPLTSGNGIGITARRDVTPVRYPHHVTISGNKVYKCSGGGIYTYNADYVTVEDNEVYENAFYSPYGNSGISFYQSYNSDSSTATKMIIRRNLIYRNKELIPFFAVGTITDGNGIIIDDYRNTQNNSTLGLYRGRTRVENNVVYDNGGRGIHVFESEFVDIWNNTTYKNSQSPAINDGEITAINANDVKAYNNIIYATGGKPANKIYNATNILFDYNLAFNYSEFTSSAANNITNQNPLFVNESGRYFLPQPTSPAIDRGKRPGNPSTDIRGVKRPIRRGVDIGAFERWWGE